MADSLLNLVVAGQKTATCWAQRDSDPVPVGWRSVILDGAGQERAVIEATECFSARFGEVDANFAHDEGEGDRSLAHWRMAHRAYFERHGGCDNDLLLWCERFRVIAVL